MNQRTLLTIAAALTAFVLVVVGGLASRLSATPTSTATETVAAPTVAGVPLDPTVQALIQEREAAYQQALAEANQRLEQANQQISQANQQLAQTAAASQATAAPQVPQPAAAASYAISVEQARQIALDAVPGATLLQAAELVSYENTPAYEVILNQGTLYIDAQNGVILANGATAALAQSGPLTEAQAAQIAVDYRGGGTVREIEREGERGRVVYEVKFDDGAAVYVDAATGQVVYARIAGAGEHDEYEHNERDGHEGERHD